MAGNRRWPARDVAWYATPTSKRPIAYSTVADSDALGLLAEAGLTFAAAVQQALIGPDAIAVCQAFIDRGFGEVRMADHGVVCRASPVAAHQRHGAAHV